MDHVAGFDDTVDDSPIVVKQVAVHHLKHIMLQIIRVDEAHDGPITAFDQHNLLAGEVKPKLVEEVAILNYAPHDNLVADVELQVGLFDRTLPVVFGLHFSELKF